MGCETILQEKEYSRRMGAEAGGAHALCEWTVGAKSRNRCYLAAVAQMRCSGSSVAEGIEVCSYGRDLAAADLAEGIGFS